MQSTAREVLPSAAVWLPADAHPHSSPARNPLYGQPNSPESPAGAFERTFRAVAPARPQAEASGAGAALRPATLDRLKLSQPLQPVHPRHFDRGGRGLEPSTLYNPNGSNAFGPLRAFDRDIGGSHLSPDDYSALATAELRRLEGGHGGVDTRGRRLRPDDGLGGHRGRWHAGGWAPSAADGEHAQDSGLSESQELEAVEWAPGRRDGAGRGLQPTGGLGAAQEVHAAHLARGRRDSADRGLQPEPGLATSEELHAVDWAGGRASGAGRGLHPETGLAGSQELHAADWALGRVDGTSRGLLPTTGLPQQPSAGGSAPRGRGRGDGRSGRLQPDGGHPSSRGGNCLLYTSPSPRD